MHLGQVSAALRGLGSHSAPGGLTESGPCLLGYWLYYLTTVEPKGKFLSPGHITCKVRYWEGEQNTFLSSRQISMMLVNTFQSIAGNIIKAIIKIS